MAFLELLVEGNKRRESVDGSKGKGKPSSQIIAIGSVGGLTRFTDSFIYNASKAAVHHLMKNLGAHFVPFDVRCNVIAPGCELFFLFRFCANLPPTYASNRERGEERVNSFADNFSLGFPSDMTTPVTKAWEHTGGVMPRTLVPAQRMGVEEEMAGTVLYLASRAGGYANGNISLIDGGFLANHAGTY